MTEQMNHERKENLSLQDAVRLNWFSNVFIICGAGLASVFPDTQDKVTEYSLTGTSIAMLVVGAVMKARSLKSYKTTMDVLKISRERGVDPAAAMQMRASQAFEKGCAARGIERAYRDFFGEDWKKELSKLRFKREKI